MKNRVSAAILLCVLAIEHVHAFARVMPLHIRVIVIAALSVLVVALRHWSLAHLSVFLLFSLGVAVINVQAFKVSAISIFVAFTASTVLVRFYGPTRDTLSWFQKGVIDRVSALLMLGTSVIAALALIIWAEWTDNLGVGFTMMKGVAHYPTWMVAGIILPLFAVLNAFSEEVAYRGILQEALQRNLTNTHLVLVLQSSAFADYSVNNTVRQMLRLPATREMGTTVRSGC